MKTNITTLKQEVAQLKLEAAIAYNAHRDTVDRLCNTERKLAEARKNVVN